MVDAMVRATNELDAASDGIRKKVLFLIVDGESLGNIHNDSLLKNLDDGDIDLYILAIGVPTGVLYTKVRFSIKQNMCNI